MIEAAAMLDALATSASGNAAPPQANAPAVLPYLHLRGAAANRTVRLAHAPHRLAARGGAQPRLGTTAGYYQVYCMQPPAGARSRLRDPYVVLKVSDADGDGIFVASDSFSPVHGAGPNPMSAIESYRTNLFDYYDELEEEADILGPGLLNDLRMLRPHFERIAHP